MPFYVHVPSNGLAVLEESTNFAHLSQNPVISFPRQVLEIRQPLYLAHPSLWLLAVSHIVTTQAPDKEWFHRLASRRLRRSIVSYHVVSDTITRLIMASHVFNADCPRAPQVRGIPNGLAPPGVRHEQLIPFAKTGSQLCRVSKLYTLGRNSLGRNGYRMGTIACRDYERPCSSEWRLIEERCFCFRAECAQPLPTLEA